MDDTIETNETEPNDEERTSRRYTYIGLAIGGSLLLAAIVYFAQTRSGPYDTATMKARVPTLWDWMELLIVPAVLALGALWFNKTQKDTELDVAEKARAADREIAEKAQATDREIAEGRQRQATLQAYYDRMTELLLTHKLREADEDAEVRSIARSRTVAVVKSLDADRNRQLFAFLQASKLIERNSSIVDLSSTDLNLTNLMYSNLSGVDLSGADLIMANLIMANLSGTNLSGTNLSGADLYGANLSEANLSGTILMDTKLSGVDLSGAILRDTHLRGVYLNGANLMATDLSGANLMDTDLSGVKNLTIAQLEQPQTLQGAIMPDGVQLGKNKLIVGPTFDKWKADYLAGHGGTETDIIEA